MKLTIEYLKIGEIKPYKRNAKLHPKEQIEQIKASISEFGFNGPIAIWNNEVVEGHGRLIAAKELKLDTVPVIRLDELSEEQRKAYALVHNKLTMNSDFDKPNRSDIHPTMKPVGLFDYQIRNSSNVDDIVLDLFNGSGTTIIACEQN